MFVVASTLFIIKFVVAGRQRRQLFREHDGQGCQLITLLKLSTFVDAELSYTILLFRVCNFTLLLHRLARIRMLAVLAESPNPLNPKP